MNKLVKDQINKSFEFISNGEKLANEMRTSLKTILNTETSEISMGVIASNKVDMQMIMNLNSHTSYDEATMEHKQSCEICQKDEYCKELEDIEMGEYSLNGFYTNGDIVNKGSTFIVLNSTIELYVSDFYVHIQKSPITRKSEPCSLYCPNQGNLEKEGDYECYDLPEEYKSELFGDN